MNESESKNQDLTMGKLYGGKWIGSPWENIEPELLLRSFYPFPEDAKAAQQYQRWTEHAQCPHASASSRAQSNELRKDCWRLLNYYCALDLGKSEAEAKEAMEEPLPRLVMFHPDKCPWHKPGMPVRIRSRRR